MPAAEQTTHRHCNVVIIDGTGILIEGVSGSGKTSLALGLVDMAKARGMQAALVCDDQALLACHQGRLVASAPAAIAGLAELRGYGITQVDHVPSCDIGAIARLVDDETLARMPEPARTTLLGIDLPLLRLPQRHEQQAGRIVLAWLADSNRVMADEG